MRRSDDPSTPSLARRHPSVRLILAYYGATPFFAALDYLFGISVRVPFLDALPASKAAYYGAGVLCAMTIAFRPRLAAVVGYAESATNIATFVLTTWAMYFQLIESAATESGMIANPFTPSAVTSLLMSAAVLAASHTLARARLARRSGQ